jgi:biofilm PGA synthesis N-glycosyltransferase PgaC
VKAFSPFGLPLGISTTIWSIIGLVRYISERGVQKTDRNLKTRKAIYHVRDIAVIIPAHNEEVVIESCINALAQIIKKEQIFVVSDGSNDRTYELALKEGCNAIDLTPGRGKAKALIAAIEHFNLYDRFKFIFIVDADTKIDKNFVRQSLPLFNNPNIAVIFGTARVVWPTHLLPKLSLYYIAYRERLNRMLQYMLIYGQTWKYTNVNYVVPGFATIYRSDILRQLEIDTPGLLIEDFNLAFQLHRKKLGKIGYHPTCVGWDQHPNNLKDYWRQVRRWNIGFFQTVRKNGFWPSLFWLSLGIFSIEVLLHSFFLLFVPLVLVSLLLPDGSAFPVVAQASALYNQFGPYNYLTLKDIFIGVFLGDYIFSIIIGLITKKPQFAIYGIFFFILHYITALILISSVIPGFFKNSDGTWASPTRRKLDAS